MDAVRYRTTRFYGGARRAGKNLSDIAYITIGAFLSFLTVLAAGGLTSMIVSAVFVLIGLTRGDLSSRFSYVLIALTNTKMLGFFGFSAAVVLCAICFLILLLRGLRFPRALLVLFLGYIVYSLHFSVGVSGIVYGLVYPVKSIAVLGFFYCLTQDEYLLKNPRACLNRWLLAYFLGMFFAVVASLGGSGRLSVVGNDSNALSLQAAFVAALALLVYLRYHIISTPKFTMIFVASVLVCLLTGSRMGMIVLGVFTGVVFLLNAREIRKAALIVVVVAIGTVMFVSSETGQSVLSLLESRTSVLLSHDDLTNGRADLWSVYISCFKQNPSLFIFGMGNPIYYGFETVAHNFLLEGLASYGLIGVLFYAAMLCFIAVAMKRRFPINLKSLSSRSGVFVLFLIPFVGNMVLHDLTNVYNLSMLFIGYFMLISDQRLLPIESKQCGAYVCIEDESVAG